jgi:cytochrome c oxidase cbb3-type subunit 3
MNSATTPRILRHLALAGVIAGVLACDREDRRFRELPPTGTVVGNLSLDEHLQPGVPRPDVTIMNPYDGNAYALSEGKRLFSQWNCAGCHSHGGGGMGPPLMDAEWIYGSDPENIVASIVQGRPNGMPSFRGRIPNQQLWQLAAYVRSLSGLTPKAASPGRDDAMQVKLDEQRTPTRPPNASASAPPGAVRP